MVMNMFKGRQKAQLRSPFSVVSAVKRHPTKISSRTQSTYPQSMTKSYNQVSGKHWASTWCHVERIYWTTSNGLMDSPQGSPRWAMTVWVRGRSYLWVPANQGPRTGPSLPLPCVCSEVAKFLSGWWMGRAKEHKMHRFEMCHAVPALSDNSCGEQDWALCVSLSVGVLLAPWLCGKGLAGVKKADAFFQGLWKKKWVYWDIHKPQQGATEKNDSVIEVGLAEVNKRGHTNMDVFYRGRGDAGSPETGVSLLPGWWSVPSRHIFYSAMLVGR